MDLDHLPTAHRAFLEAALPRLEADPRLVGVAAAGSFLTHSVDEFSDLDLVIGVEPESYEEVLQDRRGIAAGLGNLLAAFTGEHVGEPRVLICLYGPEPLHVDLKFVHLGEAGERVENLEVLRDRGSRFADALGPDDAEYPHPDLQWIEDRFWVWVHYGATKIGRGELLEAHDFLSYLRMQVLGPLALQASGARPNGVRKVEASAPIYSDRLRATLGASDALSLCSAYATGVELYVELRDHLAPEQLIRGRSAETAAREYLEAIRESIAPDPD